jgi:plastocyanin
MRSAGVVALVAMALVAVAAAAPVVVRHEASLVAVHAARHPVSGGLDIVQTELAVAVSALPELQDTEMSEAPAAGGTAITAGHWVYTVTIRERDADAVRDGDYLVALSVDGAAAGEVRLRQALANPAAREGARVAFDVGAGAREAPLFLVTIARMSAGSVQVELRSALGERLEYVWRAQTETNPTLAVDVGQAIEITIINSDGAAPHNLRILDASGVERAASRDVFAPDERTTLTWTPDAAGEHTYECRYHPTMGGVIEVA